MKSQPTSRGLHALKNKRVVVMGLGLSQLCLWFFIGLLSLNVVMAKILASFFVMIFNYVSKKFILFSTEQRTGANR